MDGKKIQRTLILIPSFNERLNLEVLLPRLAELAQPNNVSALILDDGSSDGTNEIKLPAGVQMMSCGKQKGQGAALLNGYIYALNQGIDFVATIDADGQNPPEELPSLLEPLYAGEADFTMGSRILGHCEKYSRFRLMGVHFYSYLLSKILKVKITDPCCGVRAMKVNVLQTIHPSLKQPQYQSAEVLMEVAYAGFRIKEIPVTMKRRLSGCSKKGPDFLYGLYFARTILMTWCRHRRRTLQQKHAA